MQCFVLCGLPILAIFSFFFVDRPLLLWVIHLPHKCYKIFSLFSYVIFPPFLISIWVFAFLFVRFLKIKPKLIIPFFEIVLVQALSVAVVRVIKVLIGRARPDIFCERGIYGIYGFHLDHDYHSFPSGHTMAIFTLATSFALIYPQYRTYCYFSAFMLSLNRVVMKEHYFSDVLGTIVVSNTLALFVHVILKSVIGLGECFNEEI